ncbi:hypothetical protein Pint_30868 [Pistacia integerrima]|uniref:Uncharacterized protein n=1 Tax=Pistacia integerrima TaxID=434235 RepID=A0ACC0XRC4_9ROSI|nr:hypothetical protein Pint_30868 [Pistacia integerrima]
MGEASMWSSISFRLFSMDGDFASMVVKLRKNAYTVTHLSNSKIEEELKAKMPSLDKKYTMEPEEGGAGMSLRVERCLSGFKLLKEAMAKMESNMHELSLKKQEDDVVAIHTNETAVVVISFWLLGTTTRLIREVLVLVVMTLKHSYFVKKLVNILNY